MFQRILVVCVGNICRSPTAEILLRQHLGAATVTSAGLGAMAGCPIDPTALDVLAGHGFDGSGHVARQIDAEMIRGADLILAMERGHIDAIIQRAPHARGRTFLLGKWQNEQEIPDPYRQQRPAFDHVYQLIDTSVSGWLPHLLSGRAGAPRASSASR